MNREKIIKTAKKLKALADRGVGGEKESARKKLDALLKEHGLEESQLVDGLRVFERTTLNEGSVFLDHIIKSVNPDAKINVKQNKTQLLVEVVLTDIEYKTVRQRYKFLWRAYNRERKLLFSAFLNKHHDYIGRNNNNSGSHHNNSGSNPSSPSVGVSKNNPHQQGDNNNGASSQSHNTTGGGGFARDLTSYEEKKVRYMMSVIDKLDYSKIFEMKDAESPSDMEYKPTP